MGRSYFTDHPGYNKLINNPIVFSTFYIKKTGLEIGNYFLDKDANVLEIGFGSGNFANFCSKKGVKKYTGIDIDDTFQVSLKKVLPQYNFHKSSFQEFLKDKKHEYDIIFCSHVIEHLDQDDAIDMIKFIYESLKTGGIRINYTPNANSILQASFGRYVDLTHKTIYTPSSFEQLINYTGIKFLKVTCLNSKIATNILKYFIHGFFLLLTRLYYLGMGGMRMDIYTFEFISIAKK